MAKTEITRSHCNGCERETKHHVIFAKRTQGSEEVENYGQIDWWDRYELLECAGCETVSLRHTSYFDPTGVTTVTLYPAPVARRKPQWLWKLPGDIKQLLAQVYTALDSNSRGLALMGARAVLDMVLVQQVGDVGSFQNKLQGLEKAGVIGGKNRAILEAALDAGSAASHRGYQPSTEDINAVMDILENLLQALYHLESLAKSLKNTTPGRKGGSTKP